MRNTGLNEAETGIKIAGRNINNLRYADDTILMAESEEESKSLLIKVKEDNEKAGLKLNIRKTKVMVSSSNMSWQIDGQTMETVTAFIFLASKITMDGDCSETLLCQRAYSQSNGFSSSHVWMWELDHKEGWDPRNWCFWTVVMEKTLESPFYS